MDVAACCNTCASTGMQCYGTAWLRCAATAVVVFSVTALAMPTKEEEVKEVQPVVNELMVEHVNAYKARKKSVKDVGDAAFGLVGEAEGDAAKYLLFRVAINYYSLAKDFEKAADALEAMQSQIKDLPASEVQTLASATQGRILRGACWVNGDSIKFTSFYRGEWSRPSRGESRTGFRLAIQPE